MYVQISSRVLNIFVCTNQVRRYLVDKQKRYEHGNAGRKPKTFRIPGDLIDKLKGERNQTAIVVKALLQYYGGKKDV